MLLLVISTVLLPIAAFRLQLFLIFSYVRPFLGILSTFVVVAFLVDCWAVSQADFVGGVGGGVAAARAWSFDSSILFVFDRRRRISLALKQISVGILAI